jgi:hypothetical protein
VMVEPHDNPTDVTGMQLLDLWNPEQERRSA